MVMQYKPNSSTNNQKNNHQANQQLKQIWQYRWLNYQQQIKRQSKKHQVIQNGQVNPWYIQLIPKQITFNGLLEITELGMTINLIIASEYQPLIILSILIILLATGSLITIKAKAHKKLPYWFWPLINLICLISLWIISIINPIIIDALNLLIVITAFNLVDWTSIIYQQLKLKH